MYNINGMDAKLLQYNRTEDNSIYDDKNYQEIDIVVCPYNVDMAERVGIYTVPEATGYFIIKNKVDVREGDQLVFMGDTFTILEVRDNWIWNKLANISIAVK
jgi:hypothetical protein